MNKIRCIIIDDEPPAIKLLEKYCSMLNQIEIINTYQSAIKAFEDSAINEIDLLFLDIQMPVLNGIDFLKTLKNPPSVIMTTAYRDYAVEGYDLDIVDYLLKPISFDRFLKSIDRFNSKKSKNITSKKESENFVYFNINKKHHKIAIEEIQYIESLKDYVRIFLTTKENLVVKGNIGTILKMLPEQYFIRIHRSYAIALSSLKSYTQKSIDLEGISLPIGETYKDHFFERIN